MSRDPNFVWGQEEIDQYLIAKGITQTMLDRDDALLDQLTLEGCASIGKANLIIGGTEVWGLSQDGAPYITKFLDSMAFEDFMELWINVDEKMKIASLIRYPGGYHEWLMVSALPMIKRMGISIEDVKKFVTPTENCTFYYPNETGEIGRHGGVGSTTMHNYLYAYIQRAFEEWLGDERQNSYTILGRKLTEFAQKFYPEGCGVDIPDSLLSIME